MKTLLLTSGIRKTRPAILFNGINSLAYFLFFQSLSDELDQGTLFSVIVIVRHFPLLGKILPRISLLFNPLILGKYS